MFPNAYVRLNLLNRGLQMSKAINWSGLLDGTQKTLGIINQAIPIVYQVKPLISNAKAMFRIADALNGSNDNNDSKTNNSISVKETPKVNNIIDNTSTNRPIFYV